MNRMSRLPKTVTLFEMGARDGLQNEAAIVPTDAKVRFVDLLSETGLRWIEATSFVSPKAIPQLADAGDVFARIRKVPGVRYPVLTPNLKGYERARAAGADAIAVFTAASDAFTKRNINMTIDESIDVFREVVRAAKRDGVWVRGYVSTAFGSPFGDTVAPGTVVGVSVKLMEMGCDALSIGDTIGVGVPSSSRRTRSDAGRKDSARTNCVPLSRHPRHGARQRLCRAATRRRRFRFHPPGAWADARTRRVRRATSVPKTSSTSSTGWASKPE